MKIGRRLAIKMLNASRFVLGLGVGEVERRPGRGRHQALGPGPCWPALADVVREATPRFEDYNYTRALEVTEAYFWSFCDDYVELVKDRAYGGQGDEAAASARRLLRTALDVHAAAVRAVPAVRDRRGVVVVAGGLRPPRLLAERGRGEHRCGPGRHPAILADVGAVLAAIRKAKSEAKVGMRADVAVR